MYFPEPDLPPIFINSDIIKKFEKQIPSLPTERKKLYVNKYKLSDKDANQLLNDNGIENELAATEWLRSYPEVSAIDYIVFGLVALMLPYGIYGYRRDQIRARVEEKFPDFLRDLAEYWKGGLSMTVAIQTLAKGEYGDLSCFKRENYIR